MLGELFGEEVITEIISGGESPGELYPEEAAWLGDVRLRRKDEFRRGRHCARRALARMGIEDFPVLIGLGRAPVWPHGIVGSISHCEAFCAAALTQQNLHAGLGLAVERSESLPEDLLAALCAPAELEWIESRPPPSFADWPRNIRCMKESVYKCSFPVLGRRLRWHDIRIEIDPGERRFAARLLDSARAVEIDFPLLRGRYRHDADHVYAGVTLPASEWIEDGPP